MRLSDRIHASVSGGLIVSRRTTGIVRWFDGSKGYGYISAEGQEIFVHYSAIQGNGIKNLLEGDKVEFAIQESSRGPQAVDVTRLN
jgi:CspA family cold shock protein